MPTMSSTLRTLSIAGLYQRVARRMVTWVLPGDPVAGEMLEIGAGSGAMTAQLLASRPELRAVATDFDPRMVEVERRNLAPFGDRGTAQEADATALPFEDQSFDLVLSCGMLHHVGHWSTAVAEAVRVLRPGGRLAGYDLVAPSWMRTYGSRMLRPGQLEAELRRLPVTGVHASRTLGGLLVRFSAIKNAE